MKIRVTLMLVLLSAATESVEAQQQRLSLSEMFALAEQNSTIINACRTNISSAEEQIRAAKTSIYPDINIALTGSYNGNGRIWDRDFTGGFNVDIPHWGNNFALEAAQVVYAGKSIRNARQMAEMERDLAATELRTNQQQIRFVLSGYYLELCKLANQIKVYESNIELCEKLIADARFKQSQGTALSNDKTRHELQLEDLNMQRLRLQNNMSIINRQLTTVLGIDEGVEIVPDTTLLNVETQILSEQEWQNQALGNSPSLQQSSIATAMSRKAEELERSERRPHITLVARDYLDGPVTIDIPPLNNNLNYWYAGLNVSFNISSLYKTKHKIKAAEYATQHSTELDRLAKESVRNDVYAAYVHLGEAITDLGTHTKKLTLAQQNYSVISDCYHNDMALLTDMIDAGNTKLAAELELVNARIDIIYSHLALKYACGVLE